MNPRLHENGWTVLVEDFDMHTATKDDIDLIGCWIASNTCVVLKNQTNVTVDDEVRILKMLGTPETPKKEDADTIERYHIPGSENMLIRVTGEHNHKGETGLFGEVHELDWHANKVESSDRNPIVWLRSIRGSKGSKTSWTNHIISYNNLPNGLKQLCNRLQVDHSYDEPYIKGKHDDLASIMHYTGTTDFYPPLVYKNIAGEIGLFLSWMQCKKLVGPGINDQLSKKLIEQLRDHILGNENHLYHHYWDDNDIVISEQWLGVHKRWAFDHLDKRVLHRGTVNFDNVDFSKMERAKKMLMPGA